MSTYIKPDSSGNPHSVKVEANVETKTANYTVLKSDNGKTFLSALDNMVFTLPEPENGLEFTFINNATAGAAKMNVSPVATNYIRGTFTLALSVVVKLPVLDKDIINTKASAKKGDFVRLCADGSLGWIIMDSVGVWAAEP